MKRARLVFEGRVQGVFFRANAQRIAGEMGLTGWVRNRADGSVEALVEGEESEVRELMERLRREVPSARVERVSEAWEEGPREFRSFDVRRDL